MTAVEQLASQISRTFGLAVREDWRAHFERVAREEGQAGDVETLARRASEDPGLLRRLVGKLTITETHFLRHPAHFERVVKEVGRRLRADPERKVKIWSAGCASGEEPYSIAIMLHRRLGPEVFRRIEILATDIDDEAIAKARAGRYTNWSFRATPAWVLGAYFEAGERGHHQLRQEIREQVEFEIAGLEQRTFGFLDDSLDLVLFRNVAIYFEPEALARLHRQLARILRSDGLLLAAPSDPAAPPELFESWWEGRVLLYRPAAPESAMIAASAPTPPTPARRRTHRKRHPGSWSDRGLRATFSRPTTSPATAPAVQDAPPAAESSLPESRTVPAREAALDLAHQGRIEEALSMASELMEADPLCAAARILRGQIQLAASRWAAAISDLRQAVFLAPGDLLARYWYAIALSEGITPRKALGQLDHLRAQLRRLEPESLLGDGETHAGELLDSVHFLTEGLR